MLWDAVCSSQAQLTQHHFILDKKCSELHLRVLPRQFSPKPRTHKRNSIPFAIHPTPWHPKLYPQTKPALLTMNNSVAISLNNSAVDALYAGDLQKGFKVLSHTFFDIIRERHVRHQLSLEGPKGSSSLEFSLQNCSRELSRRLSLGPSSTSDSHRFLCLNFLRMEIPSSGEGREKVDRLCSCAVAWALGFK